ncbi:MAG: ABC transporter substrate-binding protein [Actinobacteria bacterium]|nr:ABC transporter substrate-binding protein [Actinomycetota bacterium]
MRTTTRMAKLSAAGLSFALLLAACGSDSEGAKDETTTTAAAGDETTTTAASTAVAPEDNGGRTEGDGTLQLGAVLPQSGNLAQLGPPMIQGTQMAVRDINEAGGVLGKDVEFTVKDDGGAGDDDLASTSVDELINNDKVDAIVGAAASGTTKTILDRVVSSGTAQCSPSNTGSDLTQADDKGLYFRTPPPDNLQAQALAKVISDDGKANVAIIAQNTDYGTGFVRYLEPALTDAGAKVVANVTYDEKGTGIDAEVEKVVGAEPDAVALIGYPEDGGKVIAEMIKQGAGPSDVTIYVTDGMQSNELYKAVDESDPAVTAGVRGTAASAAPENGASFFPDAFKAFAPEVASPIYSAQSYDCVILFALAAQKAKSDAPFDIAKEMINVSKGETADAEKCDTYKDCVALLDEGKDINYEGASGALDFTEYGEPSAGSYDVYTFGDDGTYATDEQVVVGE